MYIPYYDNANDTNNFKVAHGFSYHNGPEWVWIYGHFLMAMLRFDLFSKSQFLADFSSHVSNHMRHVESNEWCSLPELTNGNGDSCWFSNPTQAWSVACLLEAYHDAVEKKKSLN
eukprot:TRINITY_DN0_c505_g1_i2.p1 TRINITY_DN0_c505_g1~~TRINITY_DN0_c505_g1_i2.p1  ORF type:complete len:115 (+),score=25.30 TRINITY_DN0_c505_g1_i2:45-389(+)